MDVTFETPQGHQFMIQIWYFSTVRRIKETIQHCKGIPVEAQKLFFMGKELEDDRGTEYYSMVHGSHVLLILHNGSLPTAKTPSIDIRVVVSTPSIGCTIILNLKVSDTVAHLKELLHENTNGALMASHINVLFDKVEMEDDKVLRDYSPSSDVMVVCTIVTK
jgi:hypothetical protein